jgi:hypothetical protein
VPTELESLLDRERIIDRVTALFVATDARDWATLEACFTTEVLFDMTSMTGGEARRVPSRQIVDGWRTGLAPIQAVHHQAGNFQVRVNGSRAAASCYGIAYHYLPKPSGRNTRVFVGSYDFELEKRDGDWRVAAFRFTLKFLDGNPNLEAAEG